MFKDFHVLIEYRDDILSGILLTVVTWIVSVFLGMLLGLILAVLRKGLPAILRSLVDGYIGVIRGTPFLIQLFLLYYGGPFAGISLPPVAAGIVGLSIFGSAYFAEIFRGGLLAVPGGQLEAAEMLGLSRMQTLLRVSMPQIMLIIFPSLMNMVIILLKETAVLSVITVSELTATLSTIGSTTFAYIPTLGSLALFYWISLEALSFAARAVERRTGRYLVHQE